MAWTWAGGGSDMGSLVDHLVATRRVRSPRVAAAMRSVDRGTFLAALAGPGADTVECARGSRVDRRKKNRASRRPRPPAPTVPTTHRRQAYLDSPLAIGRGQTISAPHMHAAALDLLEPCLVPGARVLDVGCGSGYLLPVMHALVSPGGCVLGVDKHPSLIDASRPAVAAVAPDAVASGEIELRAANALGDGALAGEAPFDAIHVGAAAASVPPALVALLAPGGRMVVPVGPDGGNQVLKVVDKAPDGKTLAEADVMGVRYVPLTPPGRDRYGGL